MLIREATEKDIPDLIDFQLKMALETENITLEISSLTLGVHRVFKDSTKGRYYVAEEKNETLGCLMTTYEWSDWRNGTVLWIQSVYVAKDHRGKGVFKKMYEHIQHLVNEVPDFKGIRLYVDKTNRSAQLTYEKTGMNGEHYTIYEWMKP
ncbi:MAG: Acetyltransferase, GNAT family [Cytophagales bacterium]|jgi:L-amino acid N-acyltransferase YncA|nr:GNAT family N-acetyltransferase [Bacteroidota bacterium]MBS1982335.1 GNAT family N-acetyltransferase [Bacteroidota bacterium]WHZ07565.1 MAG: Acetyltransferase, GNAT family [Cytophagales bacterium]